MDCQSIDKIIPEIASKYIAKRLKNYGIIIDVFSEVGSIAIQVIFFLSVYKIY